MRPLTWAFCFALCKIGSKLRDMGHVISRHSRVFLAPMSQVRQWLDQTWTGTEADLFPVDLLATRRDNPPTVPANALIPGVTICSHGPLAFRVDRNDSRELRFETLYGGHHGFVVKEVDGQTLVEHVLEVNAPIWLHAAWVAAIKNGHDFALEALFDRLEVALETGTIPVRTARKAPFRSRVTRAIFAHPAFQPAVDKVRIWFTNQLP